MTLFHLAAVFLALVGTIGWMNARWLHLPSAVAMLLVGLAGAGALFALRSAAPAVEAPVEHVLDAVNFPATVLDYLLCFLLFAGAMQVDLSELRRRKLQVMTLATVGVLASTLIVGVGLWTVARWLDAPLSLPWAFVFGALISPTDPVAVLSTVGKGQLSKSLTATLQGEALFNDGVGIVVFTAAVAIAAGGADLDPWPTAGHVLLEAAGGMVVGAIGGFVVIRAMRAIDEYAVEVALSLALATGVYAVAQSVQVSAPIAAATAGLMMGDQGFRTAMSDTTQRYVRGFWNLIDEILNATLFLLLGLELISLPTELRWIWISLAAVPLVAAARFATVFPWGAYFHFRMEERAPSLLLTWGGLHGALSLALALSLPAGPSRNLILSVTYAVVVVSVVVQGLTFSPLVRRFNGGRPASTPGDSPDGRPAGAAD